MPSIRRHIITGDPILFAPERAGRPNAFGDTAGGACPFCPGNEAMTPPEIERAGDPWRVRVFPNKYPTVAGHEVIVESPDHAASFDTLSNAREAIEVYRHRCSAHREAAHVALFTNWGRQAGASIRHLHSQLIPLSFVPPAVAREAEAFGGAKECPLCLSIATHRNEGLVIREANGFVTIAPSASSLPYEQWIIPLRHQAAMTTLDSDETAGLTQALQAATRGARSLAESHNVIYKNFPRHPASHFYIVVVPRMTAIAGFELATGTFIDIIDPAAAARALR